MSGLNVLVLGGNGFIGRHVVTALLERGYQVTTGSRSGVRRAVAHPVLQVKLQQLLTAAAWEPLIESFDVIVNCVGILRERWFERYDAIYRIAPVALAEACATSGKRLIHVTALGLRADASSRFITAKLAGERTIAAVAGGQNCIVRPSLLDGPDGFGARWLRLVAQWPVHMIPADAKGVLAPLDVRDLGEAIATLCACDATKLPREVELGGSELFTLLDYLRVLRRDVGRPSVLLVPAWMVRLLSHGLDLLHWTPLSWGHVELLQRDNRPQRNDLPRWLAQAPRRVGS